MTMQFRRTDEVKGINDFGQQYSDQIYNATLVSATNTTLTVPGGGIMGGLTSYSVTEGKNKAYVVIRTTGNVWVAVNQTADAPAGGTFAQDTSELVTNALEKCYYVKVGDVLNFFAPTGTTPSVSVAVYQLLT